MKQHVVPKCYLKAWCDTSTPPGHEPFIWLISRDGSSPLKRAPHKSLTRSNVYTIKFDDGKSDLRVEIRLSRLENDFMKVQRKVSERKPLDSRERAHLAAFMATMRSRTDAYDRAMRESWSKVDELVKKMEEVIRRGDGSRLPPMAGPNEGKPISSKQTEYMVENSRPLGVEASLKLSPLIWRMNMAFLVAPVGSFFVTSDCPCVWFDPNAYKRPPLFQGVGLAMPEIEITMPITPQVLVVASHKTRLNGYFDLTDALVQEFNRRTVAFSDLQIVSNSPHVLASWFDPGIPPEDAWKEPTHTQRD